MKKLIFLFFLATNLLTGSLQFASAQQFQGILVYEAIGKNKIVTTLCETTSKGRIDAVIFGLKNGQVDSSTGKYQNTLLYDFSANKLTKLVKDVMIASVGSYSDVYMQRMMHFDPGTVTISFVSAEKVNGYNCKHFIISDTRTKVTKEVWVTQDLGISSMYILPNFLYYSPGNLILQKLIAAGGSGVVVKSIYGAAINNLVSVTSGPPRNSIFQVPSGYTTTQGLQ